MSHFYLYHSQDKKFVSWMWSEGVVLARGCYRRIPVACVLHLSVRIFWLGKGRIMLKCKVSGSVLMLFCPGHAIVLPVLSNMVCLCQEKSRIGVPLEWARWEDVRRQFQQPTGWYIFLLHKAWRKEECGNLSIGSFSCVLGMHELALKWLCMCQHCFLLRVNS